MGVVAALAEKGDQHAVARVSPRFRVEGRHEHHPVRLWQDAGDGACLLLYPMRQLHI